MKRSSLRMLGSVLFISMAVLIVTLGFGNHQIASAASSQNHDQPIFNAADISAYRSETSAKYYATHQVWLVDLTTLGAADISAFRWNAMAKHYLGSTTRDLTSLNASDISAYRWNAMAVYYVSHQIWSDKELASSNAIDVSNYRFSMIEPGFWARSK